MSQVDVLFVVFVRLNTELWRMDTALILRPVSRLGVSIGKIGQTLYLLCKKRKTGLTVL